MFLQRLPVEGAATAGALHQRPFLPRRRHPPVERLDVRRPPRQYPLRQPVPEGAQLGGGGWVRKLRWRTGSASSEVCRAPGHLGIPLGEALGEVDAQALLLMKPRPQRKQT
eukprot:CAMPEP_0177772700 /NCGR_PEP_ID=MMETSP0491_2-20121128/12413_1 /TAXON_ID=63592 /ORGANISM="Tetraselmis chuii, Strain PLY429" /LENGTH=110 /DNA_ID=CAMNT_0019290629 /DNA_START=393 /DNA_END=725 /DNA_ORIENTATION=+